MKDIVLPDRLYLLDDAKAYFHAVYFPEGEDKDYSYFGRNSAAGRCQSNTQALRLLSDAQDHRVMALLLLAHLAGTGQLEHFG